MADADPTPTPTVASQAQWQPTHDAHDARAHERGWIAVGVLTLAAVLVPLAMVQAQGLIDQATPQVDRAWPFLAVAALAGAVAVGAPFLVARRPSAALATIGCVGFVGGVLLVGQFTDYGHLGGIGLLMVYTYLGIPAALGLVVAVAVGASNRSGPLAAVTIAGAWTAAWAVCALYILVTMPDQAARASYANRHSPPAGLLMLVGTLLLAAWRRRGPATA